MRAQDNRFSLDKQLPKDDDPDDLVGAMNDCLATGPSVYWPSAFWTELNRKTIALLDAEGFANFKRTISLNYFTWLVRPWSDQFRFLMLRTRPLDWPGIVNGVWRQDKSLPFRGSSQTAFAIFSKMLWRYAEHRDSEHLLARIEEPVLGNPVSLYLNGRLISQDLANSCLEYYSIREKFAFVADRRQNIFELGAGYGRTAHFILSAQPTCRYFIVDIPPALAVAQHYLSSLFSDHKVFTFRPWRSFNEVKDELVQTDLAFLLPHQAEMLPDGFFDLCINISSLHEMKREQIRAYFRMIDRLTSGYFYTKQWKVSLNLGDKLTITEREYPVPQRWQTVYRRTPLVHRRFFEAMYKIG